MLVSLLLCLLQLGRRAGLLTAGVSLKESIVCPWSSWLISQLGEAGGQSFSFAERRTLGLVTAPSVVCSSSRYSHAGLGCTVISCVRRLRCA